MSEETREVVTYEEVTIEFLKEYRNQNNLGNKGVAELLGSTEDTVKGWIRKKEIPLWTQKFMVLILTLKDEEEKNKLLLEEQKDIQSKIDGFKSLFVPYKSALE